MDRALATTDRRRRSRRFRRFEALGETFANDPRYALALLARLAPADRLPLVRGLFDSLAQGNREAAMQWAKLMPDAASQEAALTALLADWRGDDPYGLIDQRTFRTSEYGVEAALGMELLDSSPTDPNTVLEWAEQLTSGLGRGALLGHLAGGLAVSDPTRALAYTNSTTGDERAAFNFNFAWSLPGDWLKNSPGDALAWSSTVADLDLLVAIQARIFGEWSSADPAAAEQAALTLPASQTRDRTLQLLADNLATHSTAAADAWVQTLSGHDHDIVDAAIALITPVGIGAGVSQDAEGYPVVSSVVENMPAALSGQIHAGDRIVGVTRPDGVLVSTSGMNLGEIVNLVRGLPNSTVQLQVAQAQNGGFAPPTTVTLIRQRITHG